MARKKAETVEASTDTKSTTKSASKEMVLKGNRKGKVFLAGKYLNFGDELVVTEAMQKDKTLMAVITNSLKMGMVSKA